ncbi:MATE family efflux transporter [[Clostridium] colinum]|uniref:MATE family efflux transporter n=1 Tax=[Clostridium] colinum TaxID=36835 RepID=UPI002023FE57|nr:MATE family efflux transporter [[Clostridium] colinum]
MKNFFSDKIFFKNLFLLVIPIIFQELLNSSVNLVDNFMIGQLGEVAITSVGLANQIFFVFNLILFGINSGAAVFVGQYFGKGDFKGIHKVIGIGIILSILNASIFVLAIILAPEFLMSLYSKDINVIAEGVNYLRVVCLSYFVISFIMAINAALKAIRKTHFPMITTFIALITNIILNYLFIFKLGYGVKGAAMATLCARCVELISQLLIIFGKRLPIITNIKNYFNFNKKFLKSYFEVCTPIILNEIVWATGVSICNMAYKFSGTDAQSAIQITGTIQNLFVVMGVAIGGGCGILLSNVLGYGDIEKAKEYSKKCIILTVIISSIMGLILLVLSPYIINIFNVKDLVKDYTHKLLIVVAVGMIFKTYNYTTIVGILRSGGDTTYTAILDFASVWFIGIPMAFLGAYILDLPIYITYAMVYSEEIVKGFFSSARVKKNKWAKSLV